MTAHETSLGMPPAPSSTLDDTHDPALESWVESANQAGHDFPIQNLPLGRFRHIDAPDEAPRLGIAIGDAILDLQAAGVVDHADVERLMNQPVAARTAFRQRLSAGLRRGSADESAWAPALVPMSEAVMALPCETRDYTDFYTGIHHATAVGKLFRPDNPLLPNYHWVPIGYHGRASSLRVSGHSFKRPHGQIMPAGRETPLLSPSQRLDLELELGIFIAQGNALGEPIAITEASDHIYGLTLLNDWSARDVQAWEYQPLGPFLAKNFVSTVSPWLVSWQALTPFQTQFERSGPAPLPYLDSEANRQTGALDISMEVWLQTDAMRQAGHPGDRIASSNFAQAAYWTAAQLVSHHTINGCNLNTGDLLGTGTLSGPQPEQAGSLLELTQGGKVPITLSNGETRTFLLAGDRIILKAYCERPGYRRIGFGACEATVLD